MKKVSSIFNLIFLYITIYLIVTLKWCIKAFGQVPLNQLFFQLEIPLKGTSTELLTQYFLYSFFFTTLFFLIVLFVVKIIKKKVKKDFITTNIKFNNKNHSIKLFPLNAYSKQTFYVTLFVLTIGVIVAIFLFDLKTFVSNMLESSSFIEENYVEPKKVKITAPETKRNLIHIYVESLESSYADTSSGGILNYNLIPNLTQLANDNINFSSNKTFGGVYQLFGTTWTIAAIIGQTSGIPVKLAIDGNSYSEESGKFLNRAYTLGEILEKNGYTNVFMLGSDAEFAARKTYFEQNGNYEIWDYKTAIEENKISSDYYVNWGFEDKKLFEYAKEKLMKLSNGDKPFNLTLLTVDMHPFEGYLSDDCEEKYDLQIENVISCSDSLINNFINWIKKQDFYENTTIVITGDHLNMDTRIFKDSLGTRTVYNTFINSVVNAKSENRLASVFDIYPTTLASLGFIIEGNRLALGTNLFSNEKTLLETYDVDYVNSELSKTSSFYKNQFLYSRN